MSIRANGVGQGTKVELPPALPEVDPLPEVVDVRFLSPIRL